MFRCPIDVSASLGIGETSEEIVQEKDF